MEILNPQAKRHPFLSEMMDDAFFPQPLVLKGVKILEDLCLAMEKEQPKNLAGLYQLTHQATLLFNNLGEELLENDSELDTVAREIIAADFEFIASAYGFVDADVEELIEPRDW
ncbi:hypothetical protein FUA23_00795 [Neolewinella aurantiaca]|uniref:Uncharacterized protein n=1 Tax=Neolewinella aurantiaca TaxID=2602767 RepID=A0A5C7FNF6_9BACT|nr:DUF5713 family protein [Neolewinella aurantiaca]TXF91755.1 hypothetical protein FUA23_00795 [Neolewinella aurantiaca]